MMILVFLSQGCFIAYPGVCYVPFNEIVHHQDKLAFLDHGFKSLGSCHFALQASPVSFIILDLLIPFQSKIALMAKTSF